MATYKCKMCGGNLLLEAGVTVCECEYCGTKQTVPNADDEKKLMQLSRAAKLLRECDFDRAAGLFENVVVEFPEEAEAYWNLVLCRFGIEYVDDPASGKKVPTCHRSSFDSVMDDENFEKAMDYADTVARRVYREEAKAIEELRKGIIEVSGKEEPYDVFISYKETGDDGRRTIDSVIAQDIYDALTDKGYRVFFSRISLEDKLGTEYEPYIFAALNSAKVMLVVGTDYEYFNAVWVKNEWSRFLKLMAADRSKTLIPCYKDIDAYDMPKEFNKLTAQDMGKIGSMQDLLRGVEKLLGGKKDEASKQKPVVVQQVVNDNSAALLKRGFMALEDEEWTKADGFFEKVLNQNAQHAEAYLGKLMVEKRGKTREKLGELAMPFDDSKNYAKLIRFADASLAEEMMGYNAKIRNRIYDAAQVLMDAAITKDEYNEAAAKFAEISGWRDADAKAAECRKMAEGKRMEKITQLASIREKTMKLNNIIACGIRHTVGLRSDGAVVAIGDNEYGRCNVSDWRDIVSIACGEDRTVGLRSDGAVVAVGARAFGQCGVSSWQDVVSIACRENHTVGLRSDGTVVAVGFNPYGQCNVSDWQDVVSIACSNTHTVGLRSDGTVVAVGRNTYGRCDVSDWQNIVSIACGDVHTVGLRSDGTVVAVGRDAVGECDVSDWQNIVTITCGTSHTVGLLSDGTVVAVGKNDYGGCNVSDWRDIVSITCCGANTVGLRSDGTVVAVGFNQYGQCNVSDWRDIVSIACGGNYTVGLRSDGTVVAVGYNRDGRCDVSDWKLFNHVDTLEEERKEARRKAEEVRRKAEEERLEKERKAEEERLAKIAELTEKKSKLQTELKNLKGLFTGSKRKQMEADIAKIDTELKKLEK